MDVLLAEMDGRVKVSLTDSTMMNIVRSAMDRAQEKLMSKPGVLARLVEISKFYDLAVMQLDGCLKFVQDDTHRSNLEPWHEHVLDELSEIRDRLQGRLEDTDRTIAAKDRELRERVDLELRLRHALQLKDRELVSLRRKLQPETTKIERDDEIIRANSLKFDERRGEEFCELIESVDQQVSSIEQRLEPELTFADEQDSTKNSNVEQMGSDIQILKETFNLAFGKMQSAILASETEPSEQQWRWTVEEGVFCTMVNGLITDLKDTTRNEVRNMEYQVSIALTDHLSNLMIEMTNLRSELESLTALSEDHTRSASKIPPKVPTQSSKVSDIDNQHESPKDEDDGGNFVAKMVKNHESIIRRNSQEMNLQKLDALQEKEGQSVRRHRGADDLRRRIHEIISRLDNLIRWNAKMGEALLNSPNAILSDIELTEREKSGNDTMEDVWERIHKGSIPRVTIHQDMHNMIRMLKQENKEMDTRHNVMESIYRVFFKEMIYVWKEDFESEKIESRIGEEVNCIVFAETIHSYDHHIHEYMDCIRANEMFRILGDSVKEDVCRIFLTETMNRWKMEIKEGEMYLEQSSFERDTMNVHDLEEVRDRFIPVVGILSDREVLFCKQLDNEERELNQFDIVFSPLLEFSQVLEDFQCMVDRKIGSNICRLEEGKRNVDSLIEQAATNKKSESLYKEAFIRRCQNLHKAEAEVDLLGDQVDQLFELLKNMYNILQHYSPVLHHYNEVSDMVKLIKKVLVAEGGTQC